MASLFFRSRHYSPRLLQRWARCLFSPRVRNSMDASVSNHSIRGIYPAAKCQTQSMYYMRGLAGFLAFCTSSVSLSEYQEMKMQSGLSDGLEKSGTHPEPEDLVNWSGTHTVTTKRYFTPETESELAEIVKQAHETGQKLRPVGSALSPNGLGFESGGMVNLVNMDKVLKVDTASMRVTVQAGVSLNKLVGELRKYGLTLQNFASITEQQVGGFIQVGAHGTGARIPPVDEQVVGLRIVTPGAGVLSLSADDKDPSLFQVARTALGMFGIVSEVTLQCVPMHRLMEHTFVLSSKEVMERHSELIESNRHLRYMWIPYTDAVVVVTCNPMSNDVKQQEPLHSESERTYEARELLKTHPGCLLTDEQVDNLSFTTLRDELLFLDPLNVDWIRKVNEAEASYWRKAQGTRIGWSDQILQFDCGGQQWVSEVAFAVPKDSRDPIDIKYVCNLLDHIEREQIPAPAPIEQRWTAPSHSPMSPAAEKPERELGSMYSWVGIIMYLPDAEVDGKSRQKITESFKKYKGMCEKVLWPEVRAVEHWAKIEMPETTEEKALLRMRTHQKFPVQAFLAICDIMDPNGILRNDLMDTILGKGHSV